MAPLLAMANTIRLKDIKKLVLPLVRNSSYTSVDIKNFPRRIPKPEKSMQALSVFTKGTFSVYIKCLIVIFWEVTIERRGGEKGHSLSYWFERYMEFGNASDDEAPPAPPRNKDLSRNMWMQIVVMLQGMENNRLLRRGSVTTIAKRFSMACCTVHHLWKRVVCTCTMGIINSPDFNSQKNSRRPPIILWSLFMKVSRTCC